MKAAFYFLFFPGLFLVSCGQDDKTSTAPRNIEGNFTFQDKGTFAFTDLNNYEIGYAADAVESLNLEFGAFLIESVNKDGLVFYDEEDREISASEAKKLLTQTYSIKKTDPDDEEEYYYESEERSITAEDIVQVVCREDWFFNEETFEVQKRVTHLAPVIYVFDTDGDVRGKKLLFWVKVNGG